MVMGVQDEPRMSLLSVSLDTRALGESVQEEPRPCASRVGPSSLNPPFTSKLALFPTGLENRSVYRFFTSGEGVMSAKHLREQERTQG